jgi:hypothetical protein
MITATKRDEYRRKGGPISESYYSLATQLEQWENGDYSNVPKRDIAALRSKLAKAAKALDAADAAIRAAYEVTKR